MENPIKVIRRGSEPVSIVRRGDSPSGTMFVEKGIDFAESIHPSIRQEFDNQFGYVEHFITDMIGEGYISPNVNRAVELTRNQQIEYQLPTENNCSYKALSNGLRLLKGDRPSFAAAHLAVLNASTMQERSRYMIDYDNAQEVLDLGGDDFKDVLIKKTSSVLDASPLEEKVMSFLNLLKEGVVLADWNLTPRDTVDTNGVITHARTIAGFGITNEKVSIYAVDPYDRGHIQRWSLRNLLIARLPFLRHQDINRTLQVFQQPDALLRNAAPSLGRTHFLTVQNKIPPVKAAP